jgi:AraC-like DNA-binding protein
LQGKCQNPLLVELEGSFSRITILFKPLGLNNFIDRPLGEVMGSESREFILWNSPVFEQLTGNLFSKNELTGKINHLEHFLMGIFRPAGYPQLQAALDNLVDFSREMSIEEIAALVNLPLRTFNRLFKMHLGVSPVVHRQIARFRNSLENKLFYEQFKQLTEIGYNSNYYDQSYFTKLYKKLSGTNPKAFFRSVERIGDSNIIFQFVKNL